MLKVGTEVTVIGSKFCDCVGCQTNLIPGRKATIIDLDETGHPQCYLLEFEDDKSHKWCTKEEVK